MRLLLPLSLAIALCAACPKERQPTSTPDPAATAMRFAILIADAEGAQPPAGAQVHATAGSGALVFVEAPALIVDSPPEGWSRWARIGDAEARARLGAPGWLLSTAAAGHEQSAVYLELTTTGAADPEIRVKLQSCGVEVNSIAGNIVTASVPRGAWGTLLALDELSSVEAAGTVGKRAPE